MSITGNWERRRVSRREFLAMGSMSAAALALGTQGMWLPRAGLAQTSSRPYSWNPATYPFKLGVASGDPELYDTASGKKASVVLWTRLVPGKPYIRPGDPELSQSISVQGDSLKGRGNLSVGLEVGIDGSTTALRQITATAEENFGHSVHQEVDGLEPGRRYWYRFTYEGQQSRPVGYFKTPSTTLTRPLKFAFASCQRWTSAYYPAYRAIAGRTDLDLVVHLGDYIYEAAPSKGGTADLQHSAIQQGSEWCETLFDYRTRHAQYKTDLDLQAAHAAHLWLVTWDDHEVENDYSNTKSWYTSLSELNARRLAAYQAYYEHMPIRRRSRAGVVYVQEVRDAAGALKGVKKINLNRQVAYGTPSAPLAQFLVLDSRQLRTEQPCPEQAGGSLIEPNCTERTQDPILRNQEKVRRHTILSAEGNMNLSSPWSQDVQENWLKTRLTSSPRWNVLAQQIPMFQYNHYDWSGNYYYDAWDAYTAVRSRIFNHIEQKGVPNPVVLTGDMHSAWAANLEKNFNDTTRTDVLATEFCATSISSGLSAGWDSTYKNAFGRKGNTHVKFYDGRTGGYGLCTVDKDKWTTEYYLAGTSAPIKTYWVYAKGSGPSGSYGLIDPNTNRPA
jgi:alkaline phosphatase D